MNLQKRISLLTQLRTYLLENNAEWNGIKQQAFQQNAWFTLEFIDLAVKNITEQFLPKEKLEAWAAHYFLDDNISAKNIGIVMAGNIPLVGFHDFLCVFISGHRQTIKLSGKDNILLKHLVHKMIEWDSSFNSYVKFEEMLKGCDAYIATGSNNSARYFDLYFSKYPSIIRHNRTSVAVLKGNETTAELEKLSDDIHSFFGLGCRNITKLFVPEEYDFVPLLKSFNRYTWFGDHHKYRNNYDYYLSLQLMNNRFYMTNESTLLTEDESVFSPISQLHYGFYSNENELVNSLKNTEEVQCIVGVDIPFGQAQSPTLTDYADGKDTLQFLLTL
jgi:hypothetical protein